MTVSDSTGRIYSLPSYLNIRSCLLSDILDLLPALTDDTAHNGLVDKQAEVPLLAVALLALLVHEGNGCLKDAGNALHIPRLNGHDSLGPGTVRDPDLGAPLRPQALDVLPSLPYDGAGHLSVGG